MKKIIRFLVFIFFVFIFVSGLNAAVTDVECTYKGVIQEEINSADFNVDLPICKRESTPSGYEEILDRQSSYNAAYLSGLRLKDVDDYYESADGKSYVHANGKVPICNNSLRKVKAYGTCKTVKKNLERRVCNSTMCQNHTNGCNCVNGIGQYWSCPAGYTAYEGACYSNAYTYTNEVTGDISLSTLASYCSSATGGACSDCSIEYALECPVYKCKEEVVEVNACTPDFTLYGNKLYCVNPTQAFSNEYMEDTDFNVRNCSSSYITPDCGYANILIEGAYHKNTDDDAINLALRLWSYHTKRSGFSSTKTGIANRTGADCNTSIYFMEDASGHKANIYRETYKYIMTTNKNNYFEVAQKIMAEYGYLPKYITEPKTNNASFNGSTFNKITCSTSLIGVTCGDNNNYRVAFELFFNTMLGNKYMMDHLDQLYMNENKEVHSTGASLVEDEGVWVVVEYKTEEFNKVFGPEDVISCDPSDERYNESIKPYCKPVITYYGRDGQPIETDVALEVCKKSVGCMKKTKYEAICIPESGGSLITTVEVKETKPKSGASVKKLVACGNQYNNQTMFEFIPIEKEGSSESRRTETSTYYTNYICGTKCTNYETRKSNDGKCSDELNETTKTTVSDPSLSCIVNMGNVDQQSYYDYSSTFGVNTNFCRIYCSDQVEYNVAGKTEAVSGRYFEYDVRTASSGTINNEKLLSSVVKQKRTCVSEIFYLNLPTNVDWKNKYGLTKEENEKLMAAPRWTTLYEIMYDKSASQRNRKELLNQLKYDIYNCNLYKLDKSTMNSLGIYKPGDYKNDYALAIIKSKFGAGKNYGIVDNNQYSDVIAYEGGSTIAEYSNSNEGNILGNVGKAGYKVNTKSVRNSTTEGFGLVGGIKYCKSGDNKSCLQYNDNSEKYDYSDEFTSHSSTLTDINKNKNYVITYPVNNYALFEVTTETGFYNKDKYQVFEGTGNVTINTNYSDLLDLTERVYPLSKYAYNECKNNECSVTQKINISNFFRIRNNDSFQNAVKDKEFVCSVKVSQPYIPNVPNTSISSIYRNVDPENLFPNGVPEDSNWSTEEGLAAKEQIENTAYMIIQGDDLLEYSITLNPEQINNIKEYNRKNGSYSNETMYCVDNNVKSEKTEFRECKSKFLEALRGKSIEYGDGSSLGTIDPNHNNGVSTYNSQHN